MISSLFYYLIFKDILKDIPDKYFLNIKPTDYELFTINFYYYDKYYHLFSNKLSISFEPFKSNVLNNIKYYIKLIKDNKYNKEGIISLYAYLTYLVLNNYDLVNIEDYYFLNHKINKRQEITKLTSFYYDFRRPYYLFYDSITRHILKYPDIETFIKRSSINCYKFNRLFIAKSNKFTNLILKILGKIYHKNYLPKRKYQDLSKELDEIYLRTKSLINASNEALYYDKFSNLTKLLDIYFI